MTLVSVKSDNGIIYMKIFAWIAVGFFGLIPIRVLVYFWYRIKYGGGIVFFDLAAILIGLFALSICFAIYKGLIKNANSNTK